MERPVVFFKKLHPMAQLPTYATTGAAGLDLRALSEGVLHSHQAKCIMTGLAIELPPGFEGQIRPRSGLAFKHTVTVLNAPGTIDSDFRGEIGVMLINHGSYPFTWDAGDRIAQLVIVPVAVAQCQWAEDLASTDRGEGGWGHSGVK